jgi:hypothetical protein
MSKEEIVTYLKNLNRYDPTTEPSYGCPCCPPPPDVAVMESTPYGDWVSWRDIQRIWEETVGG